MGVRIATLRRLFGFSQVDLANYLYLTASAVGMYEQGRRLPTVPILLSIAKLFGITLDYLVTGNPYSAWDRFIHWVCTQKQC